MNATQRSGLEIWHRHRPSFVSLLLSSLPTERRMGPHSRESLFSYQSNDPPGDGLPQWIEDYISWHRQRRIQFPGYIPRHRSRRPPAPRQGTCLGPMRWTGRSARLAASRSVSGQSNETRAADSLDKTTTTGGISYTSVQWAGLDFSKRCRGLGHGM